MFRDETTIEVQAGKGGDGLISFRHERGVPKGGPDGGDGGRGGDVVLVASDSINSLLELGRRQRYVAPGGQPGGPRKRSGRAGDSIELEVPLGTQVFDEEHGNLLRDLSDPGQRLVVAAGGAGGQGNVHFTNSVRQAPRIATPGRAGEARHLRLELKLVAEVGLIGLPNAGKSTFLSTVTAATPKIADYPFTTLSPQVGIARVGDYDTLVLADLPGLIEGAAEGQGLGHRFLRHVERCGVLLQLVDVSGEAELEPLEAFEVVDRELAKTSSELAAKPRLVLASKCEDEPAQARAVELSQALARPVIQLSSILGLGVAEALGAARREVRARA